MINHDGDVYQGDYLHGVKEGKGIDKWSDKAIVKVNGKEDFVIGAEK